MSNFVSKVLDRLMGHKTHILVILVIIMQMYGAADGVDGLDLDNIDIDALQKMVMIGMVSTAKAAFDRFSGK